MITFSTFITDAHSMFGHSEGQKIWQPEVDKVLAQLNLPSAILFPQYASPIVMATPSKTNFATLTDIAAVPKVCDNGEKGFERFLTLPYPRAFAIASSGALAWSSGQEDDFSIVKFKKGTYELHHRRNRAQARHCLHLAEPPRRAQRHELTHVYGFASCARCRH